MFLIFKIAHWRHCPHFKYPFVKLFHRYKSECEKTIFGDYILGLALSYFSLQKLIYLNKIYIQIMAKIRDPFILFSAQVKRPAEYFLNKFFSCSNHIDFKLN